MVGGVAGAVDSGRAAEGVDLEPGIICEAGQAAGLPQRLRFEKRVLAEGCSSLLYIKAREPNIRRAKYPVSGTEYFGRLTEFSSIAGCKYKIHSTSN